MKILQRLFLFIKVSRITLILFLIFTFSIVKGQMDISVTRKGKTTKYEGFPSFGLNLGGFLSGKSFFIKSGIGINFCDVNKNFNSYQPFLGVTANYLLNPVNNKYSGFCLSARASIIMWLTLGLDYVSLSDELNESNGFIPNIGLNIYGFDIRYGYAKFLKSTKISGINQDIFLITYYIPLYRTCKDKRKIK